MKKIVSLIVFLAIALSVVPASAFTASSFNDEMAELATLRKRCAELGISTYYEDIYYYTLKKCLPQVQEDTSHYSSEIMAYNEAALQKLYELAKTNMEGYIAGTKTPVDPEYIYKTGDFNINGKSLVTDEGRPFFSIGVGHGTKAVDDLTELKKYGYSNIQLEIGVNSVIKECTDGSADFVIDESGVDGVVNALARAESADIGVTLLLSVHYFPDFLVEKYPEIKSETGNQKVILHHPKVREVVEKFIHTVMSKASVYESLISVCLANEPLTTCSDPIFYTSIFQEYLKNKHNTVENMNNAWGGTNYGSFSEVSIPTEVKGAIAYDWMQCQDSLYAEYLGFVRDIVAQYTDVPTHAKIFREVAREVTSSKNEYKAATFRGISPERIKAVSGLAGTDEEHYYKNGDGTSLYGTLQWYDILSSMYNMPVYNSEDHIIGNGDTRYNEYQRKHSVASLWQSAIHGLGMSTIWVWERNYTTGNQFANSILTRPDVIAATGKVNYDLNRLANEVTAFVRQQPRVAIWRSDATVIHETDETYSKAHHDVCDKYYMGAIYAGEKVGFVSDDYYENLNDYSLLIIPQVTHITEGGLEKIKAFIEQGGQVIIYDYRKNVSNSMKYNEYGVLHTNTAANFIRSNSTVTNIYPNETTDLPGGGEVCDYLVQQFKAKLGKNVELVYSDGTAVKGVDWQAMEYLGATLVNLCNISRMEEIRGINIKINGNVVASATDLLSGQSVGRSFSLNEKEPMLLMIGTTSGSAPIFLPQEKEEKAVLAETEKSDAMNVKNVAFEGRTKTLYWTVADGDVAYEGANIYKLITDGKRQLLGKVWDTDFNYMTSGTDSEVIVVCAFDENGNETSGTICRMNMSDEELVVEEAKINSEKGVCSVSLRNDSGDNLYKTVLAVICDEKGNMKSAYGMDVYVEPQGDVSFDFECEDCLTTDTIKVIQK